MKPVYLFIIVLCAVACAVIYLDGKQGDQPNQSWQAVASGRSWFPPQFRILTPFVKKDLSNALPFPPFVFEFLWAVAVFVAIFVLALQMSSHWLTVPACGAAILLSGFHFEPFINWNLYHGNMSYDLTQAAVFAALALAVFSHRPLWWYPLLFIGTFNKETTFALIPALWVWREQFGTKKTIAHMATSVALLGAVKIFLWWFFRDSPNLRLTSGFSETLFENARWLVSGSWKVYVNLLFIAAGSWVAIPFVWRKLSHDKRIFLAAVLPTFFLGQIYAARIVETRVFAELSVPLVAIVLPVLLPAMLAGLGAKQIGSKSES